MCGERAPETEQIGGGWQFGVWASKGEWVIAQKCAIETNGVGSGPVPRRNLWSARAGGWRPVSALFLSDSKRGWFEDCPGMLSFRWDIGDAEGRGNSGGVLP